MCQGVVWVERYGRPSASEPESPVRIGCLFVIDRCSVVGDRQACVGLGEGWLKPDGLDEESPRELVPVRRIFRLPTF